MYIILLARDFFMLMYVIIPCPTEREVVLLVQVYNIRSGDAREVERGRLYISERLSSLIL